MFRPTLTLAALAAAALTTGGVAAAQGLAPIPAAPYSHGAALPAPVAPAPMAAPTPIYQAAPIAAPAYAPPGPAYPLARNVKYKDLKNVAPCAVPQVVCFNGECGPVMVNICAPEGCVEVDRGRRKTSFDYGDYRVQIREKHGAIVVDYDD